MSEFIEINNYGEASILDKSELAADAAAEASQISLLNAASVPNQSFVVVGLLGGESSELRGVDSVTDDLVELASALDRPHAEGAPVTVLQADKFRIYRAPNVDGTAPADGAFSLLIEVDRVTDSMQTVYLDPDGGSAYWYKVTEYNSLKDVETALADAVATRGGGAADYATLSEIRSEAGFEDADNVPNTVVSRYRRRAQARVNTKLGTVYVVPFTSIPDDVREIVVLLASGWLLLKEYGELADGTNKEGRAKLKEGNEWLDTILSNATNGIYLPGATLAPTTDDDRVSGWPDDTTADADPLTEAGGETMFKIGERF